jgi:hypothetical protein
MQDGLAAALGRLMDPSQRTRCHRALTARGLHRSDLFIIDGSIEGTIKRKREGGKTNYLLDRI